MQEILIVEDERVIRTGLKSRLTGEGYAVRTARDGADALQKLGEKRPDLVLLDVMMPKMNGFCCCAEIRKSDSFLPIVFLTAKDSEADQVRGLGLGADDYVSKDAGDAVLFARIERALTRARQMEEKTAAAADDVIRLGDVVIDMKTREVCERGQMISHLTRTEADIVRLFDAHRGKIFVLDDIIAALRGSGFACEDQMVYTHLSNMRRKLGSAAAQIVNRRGTGYGFAG